MQISKYLESLNIGPNVAKPQPKLERQRLAISFLLLARKECESFDVEGSALRRGEVEGGGAPPHESHQDGQAGLAT